MIERLLVNPAEAADMIGIGRTRMQKLLGDGVIPVVRIGRSVRVPVDAIRRWVASESKKRLQGGNDTNQKETGGRDGTAD